MSVAPPPVPPADWLRLERCLACAYDLTGLPAEGVCPECGQPYDAGTVELTGTARGSHVTFVNASPSYVLLRLLPWMVVAGGLVLFLIWTIGQAFLPLAMIFALSWPGLAVGVVRRCISGRAVVRLRMNFAGIVQDDDADEPPAATTIRAVMPYLTAAACTGLLVWLIMSGAWMIPIIFLVPVAIPGIKQWWLAQRRRRQIIGTPDGTLLTPPSKRRVLLPAHWSNVATVNIGMEADDVTCRIVTTSRAGGKSGQSGDVSDIEVRCTPEQAAELRARVAAWRQYWRQAKK